MRSRSPVLGAVRSPLKCAVLSPVDGSSGLTIPRVGLSMLMKNIGGVMTDVIGESRILYQSGSAATWQTTAVWGFEKTAVTEAIDTALGGGVLFVGETPKYMTWAQWMIVAEINVNYLFIGIKGVVGYDTDQIANAARIRRYLNSVDEELLISDIFNGIDLNSFTAANPPVVPDQDGKLRITAAGNLSVSGGLFVEASSTWAEKTPAPTKKTIRTLTGNKVVYADTDPTAWPRAAVAPTRTNKCTCRKINPVDTTNIAKSGAAASVLSVVDDTAALAAVGLDKICTSGKVYKLDNNGGATAAFAIITGNCENTNKHSASICARASQGSGKIQTPNADLTPSTTFTSDTYIVIKAENFTPYLTTERLVVTANAGAVILFIIPQLEEGAFCTDPIITAADPLASITRTGTSITKPTAGLFPMVSATEAQNFGIYMRMVPKASCVNTSLFGSNIDANNRIYGWNGEGTVGIRRRVGAVNATVNITHTILPNVPVDFISIYSDQGVSMKIRTYSGGVWGAWSAWESDEVSAPAKLPAKIGSTIIVGGDDTFSHSFLNVPLFSILKLGSHATLAEYQVIAEAEVNKINA